MDSEEMYEKRDNEKKLSYDLLGAAILASPTGKEQQAFSDMYNNMYRDGLSDKEVAIQLCAAILDGLRFNNWPDAVTTSRIISDPTVLPY